MVTVTTVVYTSGPFYSEDNSLTLIKEKHNNNERYYKVERSKIEPFNYEKVKVNKRFYDSITTSGVYKDGKVTTKRM